MKNDNIKNIIIGILSLLLIITSIITILSLTDTISLSTNEQERENNLETSNKNDETECENDLNKINNVIEQYLGKWYIGNGDQRTYTHVNIKKSIDSTTGYTIDIIVNKEANYNDLELYCADNSGVCYITGDENHHFAITMANETVIVTPDYGVAGYWIFGKHE